MDKKKRKFKEARMSAKRQQQARVGAALACFGFAGAVVECMWGLPVGWCSNRRHAAPWSPGMRAGQTPVSSSVSVPLAHPLSHTPSPSPPLLRPPQVRSFSQVAGQEPAPFGDMFGGDEPALDIYF